METKLPTQKTDNATIKFTPEELKELTDIRTGYDRAIGTFGKLYLQKRELERNEKQLNTEMELLEKQEKVFLDGIVAKYGEGNYDPVTGIFTPKKA